MDSSARAAGPLRSGLKGIDREFNRQVTGSQQARLFLDQASSQLRDLKTALTTHLAKPADQQDASAVESQVRAFEGLWRTRSVATGGTLDDQLGFRPAGDARQQFSVRGLQLDSLRTGDKETLSFAVSGRAQKTASVVIQPGLSDTALVQRIDRALAPVGIRAGRGLDGDISFSVEESGWPNIRDTLTIKGEGRRFATGQFYSVRATPDEAAIRPHEWSTQSASAVHDTLRQVLAAQESTRVSRRLIEDALLDAGSNLQQRGGLEAIENDARWSASFARSFEFKAASGDYQSLAAITPALNGLHRDRVVALVRST